jgi:hypothetical protein
MSGYCKYCDTLTNDIVKLYDENHRLVWTGCFGCFLFKKDSLKWAFASSNLKELQENADTYPK